MKRYFLFVSLLILKLLDLTKATGCFKTDQTWDADSEGFSNISSAVGFFGLCFQCKTTPSFHRKPVRVSAQSLLDVKGSPSLMDRLALTATTVKSFKMFKQHLAAATVSVALALAFVLVI